MRKSFALVGTAAAAAAIVLGAGAARADILLVENSPTIIANGDGTFTYNYTLFVTSTQQVQDGGTNQDYFTFYDFAGFQSASFTPAAGVGNFVVSTGLNTPRAVGADNTAGPDPLVNPNDASLTDITFTYAAGGPTITGVRTLGVASLVSNIGLAGAFETFAGRGTDITFQRKQANSTFYIAPVPEPGEYAVAGIFAAGLVGLMVRARRRSRVGGTAPA